MHGAGSLPHLGGDQEPLRETLTNFFRFIGDAILDWWIDEMK